MENRKQLTERYKQRKIIGGVYRLTNTHNGMYLLDYATNIEAKRNSFNFMVSTGSCYHHKIKKDWDEFGRNAFVFEILETLEKKPEQNQAEFTDDLLMLQQIWGDKLDKLHRY